MMGIRKTGILLTALVMMLAATLLLGHEDVAAHAAFDRSDPAPNSILPTSPASVTVWFTEPLEFGYSSAALYDQRGAPVPGAVFEPGDDDYSLRIPLTEPLERGTYSFVWDNLSAADGHTAQGYIAFTVGTADDVTQVAAPIVAGNDGPPEWLQAVSRWLVLLSLAPVVAVWLIWLVVIRPSANGALAATLSHRTWNVALAALVVYLVANVLALLVQAATIDSGNLLESTIDVLRDTRYGELWIARLVLIAMAGVVLEWVDWLDPRHRVWLSAIALALTFSLAAPISMNAHAAALGDGRTTAIVFDWAHVTAASIWFGGLILLLTCLLRAPHPEGGRREVLVVAMPRFSAVALVCWGLLALTGAYAAWLHVGSLDALRHTDYGKALTVKLVFVGVVLLIAALNLLVITRRLIKGDSTSAKKLTWTVTSEVVLTILILLAVGRMTSLQPARDAIATPTAAASIELSLDLEGHAATLSIIPGTPGPNHFVLDLPGETLSDDTEAVIELELTDGALGVNELQLERTSGNQFEWHGSELSAAGNWTADVIVRSIGNYAWEGTSAFRAGDGGQAGASDPWRFSEHSIAALLLIAIGLIGLVVAWLAGSTGLRKESALLGAIAIVLGFGIMATDRFTPVEAGIVPPRGAATDESIARGAEVYQALCMSCHGASGQGDGPNGVGLQPSPSDFTDVVAHSHADAEWYRIVSEGSPGTAMSGFGEELTDEEIWDVINYIQAEFQQ